MQDRFMNGQLPHNPASSSDPNPYLPTIPRPQSSLSSFRLPSQCHSGTAKTNHVSNACSLPNLNQPTVAHAGPAVADQNGPAMRASPSSRLLEPSLNNVAALHNQHHGGAEAVALNNINANHQPPTSQIWNGQALNNQVAPGNRANNYWDNFRR